MRRTRFDEDQCPIARATDLMGDWWTPLVMRQALFGDRKFNEFQESLEIPKAVLTARLNRLCAEGLLKKVPYQENPPRSEYQLTDKGRAFWEVLAVMWRWSSDWGWPEGEAPQLALKSRATGAIVQPIVVDEHTGERLSVQSTRVGRNRSSPPTPE